MSNPSPSAPVQTPPAFADLHDSLRCVGISLSYLHAIGVAIQQTLDLAMEQTRHNQMFARKHIGVARDLSAAAQYIAETSVPFCDPAMEEQP